MRFKFEKITKVLASRRFFWAILFVFIFESIWFALSAAYPQAFDENFHFGLIQVYSHYWLPFLSSQPPHANAYGAVARDPSYLYHYLMSFPYRLIALFVHGQTGQVILLRFINIGLFTLNLVLLRKILRKVGISLALSNVILAVFILIPVVPDLASQINYDNLLILCVAWVALLTFRVIDDLRKRKPSLKNLMSLIIVSTFASLVKYEFLPIFLGVVLFLLFISFKLYKKHPKSLLSGLWTSWKTQSMVVRVMMVSLLLISLGMFIQRDGINLIRYHSIAPNCSKVLSINDCKVYSVWNDNYQWHNELLNGTVHVSFENPITYAGSWLYWMMYRSFFAVNGPSSGFTNYPPLPLPIAAAILLAFFAMFTLVRFRKKIFYKNPYLTLLSFISCLYLISLMAEGYIYYRYTGVLELMNGRYLLPIILFLAAIGGIGISISMRHFPARKAVVAVMVLILFLQGGGILTFIERSDSTWYWSNNEVVRVNNIAKRITKPVIVKGSKTYDTQDWLFN
ncbi:MAG TPA: hypothetical protein VMR76_01270 [Candidatus Saccharimonadia bacterium]|nr:hypothetical protein [Candidatus Saccharimonadia bacterium]